MPENHLIQWVYNYNSQMSILWQNLAENVKKIAQQHKTIEPFKYLFL